MQQDKPQQTPPPQSQGQYPPQQQQGGWGQQQPPQQGGWGQQPQSHGQYPPQQQQGGWGQQQPPPGSYHPPQQGGWGQQQPPPGSYHPPQQGGYPQQPPPPSFSHLPTQFRPSPQFASNWYGQYYGQLSPQELEEIQKWFRSVDKDRSGKIDIQELARMTLPGEPGAPWRGRPLGLRGAKKLMKVFDADRSGQLDFYEYAALHQFVNVMQRAFFIGDADKGGTLDRQEIYTALNAGGFRVGMNAVQVYFTKYDITKRGLDFVSFMCMVADMAMVRKTFGVVDRDFDGRISFDECLELTGELTGAKKNKQAARVTQQTSRPATTHVTTKKRDEECLIS